MNPAGFIWFNKASVSRLRRSPGRTPALREVTSAELDRFSFFLLWNCSFRMTSAFRQLVTNTALPPAAETAPSGPGPQNCPCMSRQQGALWQQQGCSPDLKQNNQIIWRLQHLNSSSLHKRSSVFFPVFTSFLSEAVIVGETNLTRWP